MVVLQEAQRAEQMGMLRTSRTAVIRSCDCEKSRRLSGRHFDFLSVATVMQFQLLLEVSSSSFVVFSFSFACSKSSQLHSSESNISIQNRMELHEWILVTSVNFPERLKSKSATFKLHHEFEWCSQLHCKLTKRIAYHVVV